jgi:hypothetical protein
MMPRDGAIIFGDLLGELDVLVVDCSEMRASLIRSRVEFLGQVRAPAGAKSTEAS